MIQINSGGRDEHSENPVLPSVSLSDALREEPMELELSYFARRAREEKSAAAKARHPAARKAHAEMASRYEALVMFLELCAARSEVCFAGTA
jgi:hypothetical protein